MHSHRERGFTLIEGMIAVAVIVLAIVGVVEISHTLTHSISANATQQHAAVEAGHLVDSLQADADSAIAVFIPMTDVKGVSNTDGHEVDFYSRNGSGTSQFWAYNYQPGASGATGTVQKYTYQWGQQASATAVGSPIQGVTAFTALSGLASSINSPMMAGYTPTSHAFTLNYSGVRTGNTLTKITFSVASGTQTETRAIKLIAGILPSGQKIVKGTWTPAPSRGLSITQIAGFISPTNVAAQTFTISDDPYYIGSFLQSSSNCNGIATISPSPNSPNLALSNNGSYSFSVMPAATLTSAATCTATYTDGFSQSPVTENISVAVPTIAANPQTFTVSSGNSQTVQLTQNNYGGGTFTLSANACGAAVTATGSVAATNGVANVTVTGVTTGPQCTLTYSGGWGQKVNLNVTVAASLSVWPKYVIYGANGANVVRADFHPPLTVATVLNSLLGGGVADAVTSCKARAFLDSGFTQPDPAVTTYDPTTGDAASGCYNGSVWASEPGYSGTFNVIPGNCGGNVSFGSWSATSGGKASASSGASAAFGTCTFEITSSDQTNTSNPNQIVTAQAVTGGGCSLVGETCSGAYDFSSLDNGPGCDPNAGGYLISGYTGTGSFTGSPSGLGTFTPDNANGTWTFTRTAPGTFSVTAKADYQQWTYTTSMGKTLCQDHPKLVTVQTWTLN